MKPTIKAATILSNFTRDFEVLIRVNMNSKTIKLYQNYGETKYLPFIYKGFKIDIR